jgi:hypothetical protein
MPGLKGKKEPPGLMNLNYRCSLSSLVCLCFFSLEDNHYKVIRRTRVPLRLRSLSTPYGVFSTDKLTTLVS